MSLMMLAACRNVRRTSRNVFRLSAQAPVTVGARFISDNHVPGPQKLIYPEAPTKEHYDLTTFLAYVERSRLSKKSTVYKGTHYEYTVAEALSQYGFYLKRVGGSSDRGMDLLGTWTLPSTNQTMNVIMQCKAGSRSPGPMYVRELKGAVKEAPPGWRGPHVLGLLVGEKPATKGVQEELNTAVPLGYICCSKEGELVQFLWNHKAQELGLEGVSVGVRHLEGTDATQLVLVKEGKILPLLETTKQPTEEVATILESEN